MLTGLLQSSSPNSFNTACALCTLLLCWEDLWRQLWRGQRGRRVVTFLNHFGGFDWICLLCIWQRLEMDTQGNPPPVGLREGETHTHTLLKLTKFHTMKFCSQQVAEHTVVHPNSNCMNEISHAAECHKCPFRRMAGYSRDLGICRRAT